MILLLNKDTWCSLGDFTDPSSLATMIQLAWCSALHLEPWQGNGLVHFSRRTPFRKPASSDARPSSDDTPLSGGCSDTGRLQTKSRVKPLFSGSSVVMWKRCRKPRNRASYLVKYETKQHDGSGQRNYGCSRGRGVYWMAGEPCKTASGARAYATVRSLADALSSFSEKVFLK
ncbi:inovirus-type Gp2 protein [Escherichia coli]|nr:inovirus-type Gp2 protein [Escherichia coli]